MLSKQAFRWRGYGNWDVLPSQCSDAKELVHESLNLGSQSDKFWSPAVPTLLDPEGCYPKWIFASRNSNPI